MDGWIMGNGDQDGMPIRSGAVGMEEGFPLPVPLPKTQIGGKSVFGVELRLDYHPFMEKQFPLLKTQIGGKSVFGVELRLDYHPFMEKQFPLLKTQIGGKSVFGVELRFNQPQSVERPLAIPATTNFSLRAR
ncbi:MAG: hypothetical protein OXE58_12075 [Acidobacteria bacterium]|nr:hypothetical protein [Acidobacteriota bacterium]